MEKLTTKSFNTAAASGPRRSLGNMLLYRAELIWHLTRRNFLLRYKGSFLGVLWSLFVPLSQLLVLVFVFGKVVPLKIEAYPAFVFTALLPWGWFSNSLSSAGGLFIYNRDLVRKPDFEPATLVIVDVLANLLPFLIFLPVLLAMLLIYNRDVTLSLLALPVLMMIQAGLTIGLSLIIGILNVFYRDIQHIVTIALMLLFYVTPVFYRSQNVPDKYLMIFSLNPMALLIENYRAMLFYGQPPQWSVLYLVGIISAILCGIGYLVYRSRLHAVIDII